MCGQAEDTGKTAPRGRCGLDFKHKGQLHGRQRVMPDLLLGDKASVTQGHHGLGGGEGRKRKLLEGGLGESTLQETGWRLQTEGWRPRRASGMSPEGLVRGDTWDRWA